MSLEDRMKAQRRKMAALVRKMTDDEARAFIGSGATARDRSISHQYRVDWMVKNLDGCWGQTIESMMCRLVGKKLGIVKG